MKSEKILMIIFLFYNILQSLVYCSKPTAINVKDKKSSYKFLVCKSFGSNKTFIKIKTLDIDNRNRCKEVSPKILKQHLNLTPKKLKKYYKFSRERSKTVHKFEIKNSLLYINITKKYLDNYICYSMYKRFKNNKCLRFQDKCRKIFKKNNYQIFSSIDLLNIFKKILGTINNQRKIRKFNNTILTLHIDYQDLDWAYFILDRIHNKFKIFDDFSVVLFKTEGKLYLYKFSSRLYRVQLSNSKKNHKKFNKKKIQKNKNYEKKLKKLRRIESSYKNSKRIIIKKKLARFQKNIKVCRVYEKLYNYYMTSRNKKFKFLYYFEPIIDIVFGTSYSRVHFLDKLLIFKLRNTKKKKGVSILSSIKIPSSKNTFSNFLKNFSKNGNENSKNRLNKKEIKLNDKNKKIKIGKENLKGIKLLQNDFSKTNNNIINNDKKFSKIIKKKSFEKVKNTKDIKNEPKKKQIKKLYLKIKNTNKTISYNPKLKENNEKYINNSSYKNNILNFDQERLGKNKTKRSYNYDNSINLNGLNKNSDLNENFQDKPISTKENSNYNNILSKESNRQKIKTKLNSKRNLPENNYYLERKNYLNEKIHTQKQFKNKNLKNNNNNYNKIKENNLNDREKFESNKNIVKSIDLRQSEKLKSINFYKQ